MIYEFDDFELDTSLYELRQAGTPCRIEPQVYEVLAYLVANHDRVVTKDELLDHVWPERYITEAALNTRLMAARKALGDSGKEQRFIKTIHGRGYRFVGTVRGRDASTATDSPAPVAFPLAASGPGLDSRDAGVMVGRGLERQHLEDAFSRAAAGIRQVVFVTGEPGIGKTTLVDDFVAGLNGTDVPFVARGQCIDYRGAAEAYMPVLEAFGFLARGPDSGRLVPLVAERAPTWLAQLPWLVPADQAEALRQLTVSNTRDRMLREMLELLEVLSAIRPVVLVLEDVHWIDYGTLDLIDAIARRIQPARLMVLATYRPSDVHTRDHPLALVQRELRARGYASELQLSELSLEAVRDYLQRRLPGCDCPDLLAEVLRRRTDGNPLFVGSLLESWIARGAIQQREAGWTLLVSVEELAEGVPESLRDLIGLQLEQIDPASRELLSVASVVGPEFTSAAVAAGSGEPEDIVESMLATLAGRRILIEDRGAAEFADGTVCGRFAFLHDLYQEVLYSQLPPGRQVRLHRAIGEWLQSAYGTGAPDHAAELAMHFHRGRVPGMALEYLLHLAAQAQARGAPREALEHLEIARGLLESCDAAARAAHELSLRMLLPTAMVATRGFAAPEVEEAYLDALDLAAATGNDEARASIAYSLAALHEYRGQHEEAYAVLSAVSPDVAASDRLAVEYHALLSCTHFHRGGFSETVSHADSGLLLDKSQASNPRYAALGEDPAVGCNEWSSHALWFLGYPDRALDRAREAIRLASVPERSYGLASAQTHAIRVHQLRRESEKARDMASRTVALATECGFSYHLSVAMILEGWAMSMLGDPAGSSRIENGLSLHQANGADMDRSYFLALHAEAACARGEYGMALATLDEALHRLPNGGRFFYEAEIHRLRGEALRHLPAQRDGAEACFRKALEIARHQDARSLELRAAMSMARLHLEDGNADAAHSLVQPIYEWFDEGLDTRDLLDARALLEPQPAV